MIVVATSGYWDPLHVGHLRLFQEAKKLGDYLIVIVNNDEQAKLKKGKSFMPEAERLELIKALKCVDHAVMSIDTDGSVNKTLASLRPQIFAKGGDSILENVPESLDGMQIVLGVGGDKIQSSSWLLKKV